MSRSMRSYGMGWWNGNLTVPLPDKYGAISRAKAGSNAGTGYTEIWCRHAAKYTRCLPSSVIAGIR